MVDHVVQQRPERDGEWYALRVLVVDESGEISGGTDTNGSQFFIDLAALPQLRPYYSVIGKVTEGTDVVDAIGAVAVNNPDQGVPVEPVIIESIEVKTSS